MRPRNRESSLGRLVAHEGGLSEPFLIPNPGLHGDDLPMASPRDPRPSQDARAIGPVMTDLIHRDLAAPAVPRGQKMSAHQQDVFGQTVTLATGLRSVERLPRRHS